MKTPRASLIVLILCRVASTSASTIGCFPVSATMPTTTTGFRAATAGCWAPAPGAVPSAAKTSPAARHAVVPVGRGLLIQLLRVGRRELRQEPADPLGDRLEELRALLRGRRTRIAHPGVFRHLDPVPRRPRPPLAEPPHPEAPGPAGPRLGERPHQPGREVEHHAGFRSEEHTSALQSRFGLSYAVF